MIGGKKFRTLREAKKYKAGLSAINRDVSDIYNLKGKKTRVYRYFVGTHLEWLNL
ncbi:MAG: hypothetical protein PHQ43_09020 [Dehalococcoidales bacterium]|nr:hypothetical protein [Dehalococcoidales bacterium]